MTRTPRLHPGTRPEPFHRIQSGTWNQRWWKRPGGLAVFFVAWVGSAVGLTYLGLVAVSFLDGPADATDPQALAAGLASTPAGLVTLAAALVALIPAAVLAQGVSHQLHPGFLFSVTGRVRWRYLAVLTGVAAVLTLMLVAPNLEGRAGPPLWPLLVTGLLVMPLQATAEEVFFRGWLLNVLARARAVPVVAVAVSSGLFGLAHIGNGTPSVAAYTWFVLFGVVACVLTIRTGGLEAAIGLHVAHNTITMTLLTGTGFSPAVALDAGAVGWGYVATSAAVMGLYAAFALWLHRRWGLTRLTIPRYTPAPSRVLTAQESTV